MRTVVFAVFLVIGIVSLSASFELFRQARESADGKTALRRKKAAKTALGAAFIFAVMALVVLAFAS